MAKKQSVLKMLGRYEDQLAQGILPRGVASVLDQYIKAEEAAGRSYGSTVSATERFFSTPTIRGLIVAGVVSRQATRNMIQAKSIISQPEYDIGVFARETLTLKPNDRDLTDQEVAENRRRIERYKIEIESREK